MIAFKKVVITGSKKELEELFEKLSLEFESSSFNVGKFSEIRSSLTNKRPLGQAGLVEVVLSIAAGVAANAIYDRAKMELKKLIDKGVVEKTEDISPQDEDES